MKKISLLLAVLMIMASFCLVSCDNGSKTPSATTPVSTAAATTAEPTAATAEPTTATAEPTAATAEPTTATATATATAEPTGTGKPLNEVAALTGVDPEAYTAMKTAIEKLTSTESYKSTSEIDAFTSSDGMELSFVSIGRLAIKNALSPDVTANVYSESTIMGVTSKTDAYYENGYVYYTADGQNGGNYKTTAKLSSILSSFNENIDMVDFNENAVEASKLIKNADGSSKILLRPDKKTLVEDPSEPGATFVVTDDSYFYVTVLTDSKGRIVKINMEADVTVNANNGENISKVTMELTYSYDDVVVTPPEGYETYIDKENF